MNDLPTTDPSPSPHDASASDSQSAPTADTTDAQPESATEPNPLKRFQDLINSPTTPDGHKVVAAVAAASTVTVAAVANWLMRATNPKKEQE